ncbi:hypothetical protein [Crossiella cryophila]|uniref:Uncharacterized protein n=1 Tax=Crossiella cryophila TaxID=43355 RepID=A0A7W7FRG7_9PSEU|nr:hypothetical protein [Crossiella cryophila]MBB4675157.1 hypothetical protein [Crossiella cryophila]
MQETRLTRRYGWQAILLVLVSLTLGVLGAVAFNHNPRPPRGEMDKPLRGYSGGPVDQVLAGWLGQACGMSATIVDLRAQRAKEIDRAGGAEPLRRQLAGFYRDLAGWHDTVWRAHRRSTERVTTGVVEFREHLLNQHEAQLTALRDALAILESAQATGVGATWRAITTAEERVRAADQANLVRGRAFIRSRLGLLPATFQSVPACVRLGY